MSTLMTRLNKGKRRAGRARWLRSKTVKARKLFKTNIRPATVYGHQARGYAPGQVAMVRAAAAQAGTGLLRQCLTAANCISFGPGQDPAVDLRVEVLLEWLHTWGAHPDLHADLVKAWHRILPTLLDQRQRWKRASGPMATVMAVLLDFDWVPSHPVEWYMPVAADGSQDKWVLQSGADTLELVEAIQQTIYPKLWAQADKFYTTQGLEYGVDPTIIKQHILYYEKRGEVGKAAILTKLAVGEIWTPHRKADKGIIDSPQCPYCKHHRCDLFHLAFQCKVIKQKMPVKVVEKHSKLIEKANAQLGQLGGVLAARAGTPPVD